MHTGTGRRVAVGVEEERVAEEEQQQEEVKEESSGGGIGGIIAIIGVLLVAAIAGVSVYLFVLAPRLDSGDDAVAGEDGDSGYIPAAPAMIEFPTTFVNVLREGEMPSSTLMFGVTLECENLETVALVEIHHARFVDTISKRHDSRTRSELDDVLQIKTSIQRQLLQELNDILERVQEEPDEAIAITAVFHHTFAVQDQG